MAFASKAAARFVAGVALGATMLGAGAASAACTSLRAALGEVETCQRRLLRQNLCSAMTPDAFEKLVTGRCSAIRKRANQCLTTQYMKQQGLTRSVAAEGAAGDLKQLLATELSIFTAGHDGTLRDPHFPCPAAARRPAAPRN